MRIGFLVGTVAVAVVGTVMPHSGVNLDPAAGERTAATTPVRVVEAHQVEEDRARVTMRIAEPARARTVEFQARTGDGTARTWATVPRREVPSGPDLGGTRTFTLEQTPQDTVRYRALVEYRGKHRPAVKPFSLSVLS